MSEIVDDLRKRPIEFPEFISDANQEKVMELLTTMNLAADVIEQQELEIKRLNYVIDHIVGFKEGSKDVDKTTLPG